MFKWLESAKKLFSTGGSDSSLVRIHDDGFMSNDIAVSIEDIISNEENEDIGKLHVLSLTEFHQALGEMWDAREAKIFLLTEGVLRDRVGQGNRWEHQSKEIYIMLFPKLSEIEAEARAYDIAEELGRKIIGERFDGERRPLVRVAGVDPKDALSEDGTLNIAFLEKAGRDGDAASKDGKDSKNNNNKKENADATNGEKGPDWQPKHHHHENPKTDWRANPHAHQDSDTNWQENRHTHEERNANWEEQHRAKQNKSDPQWVSMSREENNAQQAKPVFSVEFSPCWDKESESLRIYRSILNLSYPSGTVLSAKAAYGLDKPDTQKLKTDLWVLNQSAKALFGLQNKQIVTPVFVPFHSASLRGDSLEQTVATLSRYNESLRTDYLIIEIWDDGNWTEKTLRQSCLRLKEQISQVAFCQKTAGGFTPLCISELDWSGVDFADMDQNNTIDIRQLESFLDETLKNAIKPYAFGLQKRAQISELLQNGMSLINGAALVRNTDKLRPPFALPSERLLKQS